MKAAALIFIHTDAVELKLMMKLYWRFIISCRTAATSNEEASFLHQFLQRQNHPENIIICVSISSMQNQLWQHNYFSFNVELPLKPLIQFIYGRCSHILSSRFSFRIIQAMYITVCV